MRDVGLCEPDVPEFKMCVGSTIMLMILTVMAFAVSGGLYLGTIAFSAYETAQLDKAIALFQKASVIMLG